MSKGKKVTLGIIGGILIFVLLAVAIYYLFPWNSAFFSKATKEFLIQGLDTNFTAQGMANVDGTNTYIISGYMSDGAPSRYYIIDTNTGEYKFVTLTIDGKDYTGHAGGVEVKGSKVWTVSKEDNDGVCYCFDLYEALLVEDGGKVEILSSFTTYNGADFVFEDNNILWVGEFYRDGNYETDVTHHMTTSSGEMNKAVVFGYTVDLTKEAGVASSTPAKALSVRNLCQGMTVTKDGKFIMSTSYSIVDSNIFMYNNVLMKEADSEIVVRNTQVPLWFLDNNSLISQTNAPSMSEELVVKGDKVYILFESACKKYKLFNRKQLDNVYSLPISFLEG